MKTVNIDTFKSFLTVIKTESLANGWTVANDVTKPDGYRDLILLNQNGMYASLSEGYGVSLKNLIMPNFFQSYNAALDLSGNIGAIKNSYILDGERLNTPVMRLIDNSMTLFLFIDSKKILVVAKVDQEYSFLYLGEGDRLGTYEQYKKPWIVSTNGISSAYAYTYQTFFANQNTIIKDINTVNMNINLKYPTFQNDILDYKKDNILIPIMLANSESYVMNVKDCFHMSSKNNIISENILVNEGVEYITFRTSPNISVINSYIAIKKG